MDEDLKSFLRTVASIVVGGALVYYLFYRPHTQSVGTQSVGTVSNVENHQKYTNAEIWHPIRDQNGHITDLQVSRNAQIGNGNIQTNVNGSTTTYLPLENVRTNQVNNKIDVDMITNMVQNRLQKRWVQLNKKTNDLTRQQRYGFS